MFVRYFKYIFGADGTDIAAENFDKGGSGELVVRASIACARAAYSPGIGVRPARGPPSAATMICPINPSRSCNWATLHCPCWQGSTHAKINQCIIGYCGITNLSKVSDLCGLHIAQVINMVAPSPISGKDRRVHLKSAPIVPWLCR